MTRFFRQTLPCRLWRDRWCLHRYCTSSRNHPRQCTGSRSLLYIWRGTRRQLLGSSLHILHGCRNQTLAPSQTPPSSPPEPRPQSREASLKTTTLLLLMLLHFRRFHRHCVKRHNRTKIHSMFCLFTESNLDCRAGLSLRVIRESSTVIRTDQTTHNNAGDLSCFFWSVVPERLTF